MRDSKSYISDVRVQEARSHAQIRTVLSRFHKCHGIAFKGLVYINCTKTVLNVNYTKYNIISVDFIITLQIKLDIKFRCFAYNNKNWDKESGNKTHK